MTASEWPVATMIDGEFARGWYALDGEGAKARLRFGPFANRSAADECIAARPDLRIGLVADECTCAECTEDES